MIYHNGNDDFNGLRETCRFVTKELREHVKDFDAIVCQGISGQCVGFIVAMRLNKPLMVLRKDEPRHGCTKTLVNKEHAKDARVLFLDDFISGGNTLRLCTQAVEKAKGRVVAQYEYSPPPRIYDRSKPIKTQGRYKRYGSSVA